MNEKSINGYSCVEEKKRLSLFFPKSNYRYVVSFYDVSKELLPKNVEIIYPIIRDDLKTISNTDEKDKTILVYFSKYINISIEQKMEEIIKIFNQFPKYKFIIFSTEHFEKEYEKGKNVIIQKNDRDNFVNELKKACCVISTAGHTLISEALYCGIPTFVIPLPTFDQNYCGKFLKENKIGYSSDKITTENLNEFITNIDVYKNNMQNCTNLVKKMDSLKYLVEKIENYKSKQRGI